MKWTRFEINRKRAGTVPRRFWIGGAAIVSSALLLTGCSDSDDYAQSETGYGTESAALEQQPINQSTNTNDETSQLAWQSEPKGSEAEDNNETTQLAAPGEPEGSETEAESEASAQSRQQTSLAESSSPHQSEARQRQPMDEASTSSDRMLVRERLEMSPLSEEQVKELAKGGFEREEVEEKVAEVLQEQGMDEAKAEEKAKEIGREITHLKNVSGDDRQYNREALSEPSGEKTAQAIEQPSAASRLQREQRSQDNTPTTQAKSEREQSRYRQDNQTASTQSSQAELSRETTAEGEVKAPEGATVKDSAEFVLHEETLNVEKRQVTAGGILLRKKVVSEDVNKPVELRRETIEIVKLTPEEAERHQQERQSGANRVGQNNAEGQPFQEQEIFIPLMKEEPTVNKEVQTRQYVRATKESQTEQGSVSATVKRETLEVERIGENESGQRDAQFNRDEAEQSETAHQSGEVTKDKIKKILTSKEGNNEAALLNEQQIQQVKIDLGENGTVTLRGQVPSQEKKEQIEKKIKQLDGVESVRNQLTVSGENQ